MENLLTSQSDVQNFSLAMKDAKPSEQVALIKKLEYLLEIDEEEAKSHAAIASECNTTLMEGYLGLFRQWDRRVMSGVLIDEGYLQRRSGVLNNL
jgi:hypothetical protein